LGKRVLIAEDEPNIVTSLEFLMHQEGYETCTSVNGEDALRAVSEFRPDLLLLDVMLPLKSGFQVCQTVRGNEALKKTKIIMLTAKGREIEVEKGLALGADAYITKPFATRELLDTVKRLLGE
jgi:DNA-binding response OmpR family regulator